MTSRTTVLVLCTIALIGGLLLVLKQQRVDSESVVEPQAVDAMHSSAVESGVALAVEPDVELAVDDSVGVERHELVTSPSDGTMAELKDESSLTALLPAWMLEEAVDVYFETAEVMGETVARCRGRYTWEDGAQMEYELTDVGATPNPQLIKGLGFNFDQQNTESESGYVAAYELEHGTLMNHEYDEGSGEGSLQLLVNDRYLLEVQLEGFEAEAFEDVLENHIPLDQLLKL